jgi:hypothetical protein
MPKEVSKIIEDQAHDDEYFFREQVHEEICQEGEVYGVVQHV